MVCGLPALQVQYHSDGRSAGHGVVIYETIEDAEKALVGTNGYRLEGRTIEVSSSLHSWCSQQQPWCVFVGISSWFLPSCTGAWVEAQHC